MARAGVGGIAFQMGLNKLLQLKHKSFQVSDLTKASVHINYPDTLCYRYLLKGCSPKKENEMKNEMSPDLLWSCH